MTLEDFFTLTEMKDGLTAPSRVEELVTLMQSEKDSSVNNAGEVTRQWVAVASTIAATENKDCLDLFIQLDGLLFVDKWLKDAQSLVNDSNESFVEESITALLRALEKLHIDNKKSVSTGIWSTVEKLLGHKSLKVQDLARLLFDSWKQDGDAVDHVENTEVLCGDGSPKLSVQETKPSTLNSTLTEVGSNSKNHPSGTAQDETLLLSSLEGRQPEIADVQIPTSNKQSPTHKQSENEDDKKDMSPDPLGSVIMEAIQQSPKKDESSVSLGADALIGSRNFPDAKTSNAEVSDDSKLNQMPENEIQKHTVNGSPKILGVTDICSVPTQFESGVVCSDTHAATVEGLEDGSVLQKNADANEDGLCQKLEPLSGDGLNESCKSDPQVVMDSTKVVADGTTAVMDDTKVVMDDAKSVDHCNTAVQDSDCSNIPQESSGNGSLSGKGEDMETTSRMDDSGADDEDEDQASDEGDELTTASVFPINIFEKTRSDIDVEYGMVDALEVARQVAQEVEREVVDYREPNCSSSSGKMSGGGLKQPGSPDSINEKHDPLTEVAPMDVSVEQGHSVEVNPEKDVIQSEHQEMVPEHSIHDMESSQVTETAQEPEVNSEKGLCGFDLNEEVSSDEMDRSVNPVSAPIPFSRPPPAADLPVAPLHFEGAIGLKGSLGNSAFRRASPRRFSDSEKNVSTGATTDSSKQRPDYLCLDLNVALGGDDLEKQIPLSSGLPSGESSGEVSQSRLGRPNLDLNRIDDDGDTPLNIRVEGQFLYNRNARRSPSPASSSSSMQPLMRNFDLNDRPFFLNDSIDQGHGKPSQSATAYRGQLDGSVISIMGTRVEIKRNDVPQTLSLPNGKGIDTAVDPNLARAGSLLELGPRVSYSNSPIFGYNGLATGPTMSFSSTMYGSGGTIPYMVDSRGSPVVPQVLGSASAVPPFSQTPFIVNMNGVQPGLNGAGPSRPSFDLNSGFMVDSGNRDSGLRHLFIHGQGGSLDEHLRNSSQPPSSSNVGGKRKEPEGGWEPYPFNYRHQQPPRK